MALRLVPSLYSESQLRSYLSAISLPGHVDRVDAPLPPATLATLSLLMAHHLSTFPFENTSIHYEQGHSVSIHPDHVFRRFVGQGKGGYCMQQNLLFLNVLRALGYRAYSASGRVCENHGSDNSSALWTGLSHMVLFVLLPRHDLGPNQAAAKHFYLVDVGFGASGLMRPLLLRHDHRERGKGTEVHRVIRAPMPMSSFDIHAPAGDEGGVSEEVLQPQVVWRFQSQADASGPWKDNYSFLTVESFAQDFQAINTHTSTSPDSIFTKTLMVVRHTIVPLPGGIPETRQKCRAEGLDEDLYPYHPSQIAQDVLFRDKLTRRPAFDDPQRPPETVDVKIESQRINILKKVFLLLGDVNVEEASRMMQGRSAEL